MIILAGFLTALAPTPAGAATININPVKDNMLYEHESSDGDRADVTANGGSITGAREPLILICSPPRRVRRS